MVDIKGDLNELNFKNNIKHTATFYKKLNTKVPAHLDPNTLDHNA
jgi:hypothetical protein